MSDSRMTEYPAASSDYTSGMGEVTSGNRLFCGAVDDLSQQASNGAMSS